MFCDLELGELASIFDSRDLFIEWKGGQATSIKDFKFVGGQYKTFLRDDLKVFINDIEYGKWCVVRPSYDKQQTIIRPKHKISSYFIKFTKIKKEKVYLYEKYMSKFSDLIGDEPHLSLLFPKTKETFSYQSLIKLDGKMCVDRLQEIKRSEIIPVGDSLFDMAKSQEKINRKFGKIIVVDEETFRYIESYDNRMEKLSNLFHNYYYIMQAFFSSMKLKVRNGNSLSDSDHREIYRFSSDDGEQFLAFRMNGQIFVEKFDNVTTIK